MANEKIGQDMEGGSTPRPDPTSLTTAQTNREIALLKELIFARLEAQDGKLTAFDNVLERRQTAFDNAIESLKQLLEVRLDAMDKATVLHQSLVNEIPARVDEKISSVKAIHEERFNSVQTQFRERDVRATEQTSASKVAVDAALQAAKEAVGEQNKSSALAIAKSETATIKQIEQLNSTISAITKGNDDKINDVKDRIGRMESAESALTGSKKTMEWSATQLIVIGFGVLGALLSIVTIVVIIWMRGK